MSLSNLLSGFFGAFVGGLLAIVASVITMRYQRVLAAEERQQARLQASRAACSEILANLVTVKYGLKELASPEDSPTAESAFLAGDRIVIAYTPLIVDQSLRSQITDLAQLLNQWKSVENVNESDLVKEARKKLVLGYMAHLSESLGAHVNDLPVPPGNPLPDLMAVTMDSLAASERPSAPASKNSSSPGPSS